MKTRQSRTQLALLVTLSLATLSSSAGAGIVNGSFEDGMEGWLPLHPSDPSMSYAAFNGFGQYAGVPTPPHLGEWAADLGWSGARQVITLRAGDIVEFWWSPQASVPGWITWERHFIWVSLTPGDNPDDIRFWADQGLPENPAGWYRIEPANSPNQFQWIRGSVRAEHSGVYNLAFFGMSPYGWHGNHLPDLIDGFRVVPSPGAAVILGLAGLLTSRRRR